MILRCERIAITTLPYQLHAQVVEIKTLISAYVGQNNVMEVLSSFEDILLCDRVIVWPGEEGALARKIGWISQDRKVGSVTHRGERSELIEK